jgi:hypothetical protein
MVRFRAGKNVAKFFRKHGLMESSILTTRKPLETRAIAEKIQGCCQYMELSR